MGPTNTEWAMILGGIAAILTAVLVPMQGMVKEWLGYKGNVRDGATLKGETTKAIQPAIFQDRVAMDALTEAVQDIAAAIREGTESDVAVKKDRLAVALERFVESQAERERAEPVRRGAAKQG